MAEDVSSMTLTPSPKWGRLRYLRAADIDFVAVDNAFVRVIGLEHSLADLLD